MFHLLFGVCEQVGDLLAACQVVQRVPPACEILHVGRAAAVDVRSCCHGNCVLWQKKEQTRNPEALSLNFDSCWKLLFLEKILKTSFISYTWETCSSGYPRETHTPILSLHLIPLISLSFGGVASCHRSSTSLSLFCSFEPALQGLNQLATANLFYFPNSRIL